MHLVQFCLRIPIVCFVLLGICCSEPPEIAVEIYDVMTLHTQ